MTRLRSALLPLSVLTLAGFSACSAEEGGPALFAATGGQAASPSGVAGTGAGAPAAGNGGAAPGAGGSSEVNGNVNNIAGGSTGGSASSMPSMGSGGTGPAMMPGTGGSGPISLPPPPTFAGCAPFPMATGTTDLSETMDVNGNFDGGLRRFRGTGDLGGGGQAEGQDPLFVVANGGTLRNVIIGAPAADGIHCEGSCTLENVWWEDVGEDAATFLGTSDNTQVNIACGGARGATDKVMQHNGGGTVTISKFIVESFGKLYRSCGNCDDQFERHLVVTDLFARAPGDSLAGINENFGDTATLTNVFLADPTFSITVCERYQGNDSGAEPVRVGTGPDAEHCLYQIPSIHYTLP